MTSTAAFREPEPGRTDHGAAEAGPRATEAPLGARPAGVRRIAPPPVPTDGTREALDLLVAALEHRELGAAATAVVNRMATAFGARRVSLGMWDGKRMELVAVSGSAAFDAATGLSLAVRDAMHEAVVQRATLTVPTDAAVATRED